MNFSQYFIRRNIEIAQVYWLLIKIILPIAIVTQLLVETGILASLSPIAAPIMDLYGLPPELAFAWVTGLLTGVWGAFVVLFTVVPVTELTTAQMTIFSSLILFAHALPIEQRIIQKAGPGFIVTSVLRTVGGMIYAMILYQVFEAFDLFSQPIAPAWLPDTQATGWSGFLSNLAESLFWMFIILFTLAWFMEILKWSGVMDYLKSVLAPFFILAGIRREASQMVAVGLLLGISYGGGLLIQEAKNQTISYRQIFLSCVFMGFAHGMIDDTIIVIALGADFTSIFFGRIIFAILATGFIALILHAISDRNFLRLMFNSKNLQNPI